ncbi:MAG: LysR family transcriptional regulator [Planctomycetota bacterium]|jgi:DNA-binding transcriptional LysR family regulator
MDESSAALVGRIWNWLPVFRAVAETEHLPTASALLFVTPSALSRTIQLLESEMGRRLFRRVGRRIELNTAGESLLARVRDGMRLIEHGVLEARDETLVGALRVYSGGVITPLHVEPALERMRSTHPQLVTYLRTVLEEGIVEDLLRGRIDLAFQSKAVTGQHIETEHLGDASNGVYCGRGHPLYGKRSVSLKDILEHSFIAPVPDEFGVTHDGWPTRIKRRVSLFTDHMAAGVRACEQGHLLAVLPDAIAGRHRLRRLPMDEIPNSPMYVMHQAFLANEGRAQLFLSYVREDIGSPTS